MTVRELVTTWGFDIDTGPLRKMEESIKGMRETFLHLTELIAGEGASLFGLAETTADSAANFKKTAEEIGTTTGRLQELTYAAKQWDVNEQAVRQGMRHLSVTATEAMNGSVQAARILNEAGVKSLTDGAGHMLRSDQILDQIARHLKTLPNDFMKVGVAQQVLGRFGTELMPLFNRWGDELNRVTKEGRDLGFVMDDVAINQGVEFKESMNQIRAMVTGLRNQLGIALMPAVQGIVKKVIEWYQANRQLISSQIIQFAHRLGEGVSGALKFFMHLLNVTMTLINVLGGLGGVLKWVTALFIAWTAVTFIATVGQMIIALNALRASFIGVAIAKAFATGGWSLVASLAGGAAALAGAGYLMSRSDDKFGAPATNLNGGSSMFTPGGGAPGGGGYANLTLFQTNHITMPPGSTHQQAQAVGEAIVGQTKSAGRTLVTGTANPASR